MHTEKKGLRAVTLKCIGVITSRKIYFVKEGTFTKGLSAGAESVPLGSVSGISRKRQLGLGTVIEVSRANNTDQLIMCNEDQAAKWVEAAKKSTESVAARVSGSQVIQQALDPIDQIKKLKDLVDLGVITQEEFEAKKKELMDKI